MTPQIKQRIDQIRRGEVPEGYKKTKVGIVPEEWKETTLSEYLFVNNDKNENLRYGKDDVFSVSGDLGIVNQIDLLGRSYAGASVAPYGIMYPNDVVYTKSPLKANPYGIIKTNLTEKVGIVSTLYAIFHCKNNVCPKFVQDYFSWDHRLNNYLFPIVNIGAKHDMKISDDNSLKGIVVFPPLAEQEKIAKILQTQDKVVELQQKKIEELKRLKKAYLSKMFPKKGCNVPEVRFPGFTYPWEQRKLRELGTTYTGLTGKSKSDFGHGDGKFITYMNVFSNPITSPVAVEPIEIDDRQNEVQVGDAFFTTSSETPDEVGMSSVLLENKGKTYLNSFCFGYRPTVKMDSLYLAYMLRSDNVRKKIIFLAQGISRYNISKNKMMDIQVPLPSIEEQKQIGLYFQQLDHLITLHQRKLDEEQKKKKALMQLLLTGIARV